MYMHVHCVTINNSICMFLLYTAEVDECSLGYHNCHQEALCTDIGYQLYDGNNPKFTCQCKPGYAGNGTVCRSKSY